MDSGPAYYHESVEEVAKRLGVDPAAGLTAADAARLLASHGPNALPAEKPTPEWQRFVDEYKSYLQIILLVAGVVSLVIAQWGTGVLLLVLTVVNAVVGHARGGQGGRAP